MSVREYNLQYDSLARYAPLIVVEMSDRVHQFVVELGSHLINECFTTALLDSMDISHIQAYVQNLEDQKWKQYENRDEGQRKKARSSRQPEDFPGDPMPPYPIDSIRQMSSRISGFQNQRDSVQMRAPPPRCSQCGRAHSGQCHQGSNPTRSITVSSSLVRPLERGPLTSTGRGRGRDGASSSSDSHNRIYALAGHQDPEATPDDVSGTMAMGNVQSY
uniref:Uncharacterized protein LOC104246043 n=1 Tax=Nicotiana sylvestris TaxID=4096 RepID=A0A1U7YML2_NICSY|nr:PREDICTED: uncharacterized protein LOC104246043 [Nicotiana sylvestris]